MVGGHVLCDWKEADIESTDELFEECANFLNYQSVVSDKTDKAYKRPRYGVIGKKAVALQLREDVYGMGRGFVALFTVDVKKNSHFWGEGIDRSQIIKIEGRGRPSTK